MFEEEIKRIRIWKYEFTINGLLNIVFGALLIICIFLPWFDNSLIVQTETWRTNVVWGHFKLSSNGLGIINFDATLTYKDETGAVRDVLNVNYFGINIILSIIGIISLISSIFLILSGLADGGVLKIGFLEKMRERLTIIFSLLVVVLGAIYANVVNSLKIGKTIDILINIPEREIAYAASFQSFGEYKLAIFEIMNALEAFSRAGVRFNYNLSMGLGLLLWSIISIITFIQNVHYIYFTNRLKLRTAWKVRLNLAFFILLSFLYPVSGFVKVTGSSNAWGMYLLFFSITSNSFKLVIQLVIIIVFAALLIFLIFMGVKTRGAGILMTNIEFIPLDLPPEEIAKRTKLLPIYSSYIGRIKLFVTIFWLILIVSYLSFALNELLKIYLNLVSKGIGYLWVEPLYLLGLIASIVGLISQVVYVD